MAQVTYLPKLQATIDQELKRLRQELALVEQGQGTRGERPYPPVNQVARQLGDRVSHLEQIREWLLEDKDLMRLVDDVIRQEVWQSERRQRTLSIVLAVLSLIVGWLLSLVQDPLSILHHFGL